MILLLQARSVHGEIDKANGILKKMEDREKCTIM